MPVVAVQRPIGEPFSDRFLTGWVYHVAFPEVERYGHARMGHRAHHVELRLAQFRGVDTRMLVGGDLHEIEGHLRIAEIAAPRFDQPCEKFAVLPGSATFDSPWYQITPLTLIGSSGASIRL